MATSWQEISSLELAEAYPEAIEGLESRLESDPAEIEAVIRLGFDLWLAVAEADRLGFDLPWSRYTKRFRELLEANISRFGHDPDFCWVFGLALSLSAADFAPSAAQVEEYRNLGESLHSRAEADEFYSRFRKAEVSQEELASRFGGRGSLASYYAV